MLTLSKEQCITLIKRRELFEAEVEGGAFSIKIQDYSPIVCTAIHAGHNLREELQKSFLLSQQERFFEEDPYTEEMIASFPIVLKGNDSRFEYDLNRAKTLSTYFKTAWDKQVWQRPLSNAQRLKSHTKHQSFYDVLEAILHVVEKDFGSAIVFDIHSYNYKRIEKTTPTFNIGTAQIDIERWGSVVKRFEKELNKISLPNIEARAACDEVFQGRGYLISHVNAHFDKTLVLPTEVKKVFMDESSGELYPIVLEHLTGGMKQAISSTATYFMRRFGKKKQYSKADVLSSSIPDDVLKLDRQLFNLCKSIETLHFINPVNLVSERKKFFARRKLQAPEFKYKQLNINPYQFREKLYKLPVDDILDADIKQLYRHIIDNLAIKIDLLTSVGTEEFLYNSLRYYGEPEHRDIQNAKFILHAPSITEAEPALIDAKAALSYFQQVAKQWSLNCRIELSAKTVAKAMVDNHKRLLLINKDALFTETELVAFAHHELGIHMVTTLNAKQQPLKLFSLGLMGNTHTQEGLAIYSEYCSGNLTLERLKTLALRVLAVKYMLTHHDFVQTYQTLIMEHQVEKQLAFTLTTRVYRGGGFTKDFLYLRGFKDIVELAKANQSIEHLLVGKTGVLDFPIISELIERQMLTAPKSLFDLSFKDQASILDYVVSGIY